MMFLKFLMKFMTFSLSPARGGSTRTCEKLKSFKLISFSLLNSLTPANALISSSASIRKNLIFLAPFSSQFLRAFAIELFEISVARTFLNLNESGIVKFPCPQ